MLLILKLVSILIVLQYNFRILIPQTLFYIMKRKLSLLKNRFNEPILKILLRISQLSFPFQLHYLPISNDVSQQKK